MSKSNSLILFLLMLASSVGAENKVFEITQGVTNSEIRVGIVSDLSGPLSKWGVPWVNGMRYRFDEVNAAGGVYGRNINVIVEDQKYQVSLAIRATNKLTKKDKVFALIGTLGTSSSYVARSLAEKSGVLHLFPGSAAASMYEPISPGRFSLFLSYAMQTRGAMLYFSEHRGVKNVCLQAQASDYGKEIAQAFTASAEEFGMVIAGIGTHKTTTVEFAEAAVAINSSSCELLVLGTSVTDTIPLLSALKKTGWAKPIVGNMDLPLGAVSTGMEGMYSLSPLFQADFKNTDDDFQQEFALNYEKRFGYRPAIQAQIGYVTADLFIKALDLTGEHVTRGAVESAIEAIRDYTDPFGGPSISFGPDKHHGVDSLVLSQIQNSRWVVIEKNLPY